MLFPLFDHNPTKRFPLLTILLIIANVWVFIQCQQLSPAAMRNVVVERGFIPKRLSHLNEEKPVEVVLADAQGRRFGFLAPVDGAQVYPTLLSMMFLHGGWLHLISNMWMLWVFGNNIEDRLGHVTFIGFYALGGVIAALAQWASDPESTTPVIGASGAVWAVLGGYAVTYPWAKVKTLLFIGLPWLFEMPALIIIAYYFVLDLLMVLFAPGLGVAQPVAHWAHLGGCAAGVTLLPLLAIGVAPPEADWRSEVDAELATGQRVG